MNTNPNFIMITDSEDDEKFILNVGFIEYAYKKDKNEEYAYKKGERDKNENITVIIQKDGKIWEVKETVEELYNILTNNNNNNNNNTPIKKYIKNFLER